MDKKKSGLRVAIQVDSGLVWKLVVLGLMLYFSTSCPIIPERLAAVPGEYYLYKYRRVGMERQWNWWSRSRIRRIGSLAFDATAQNRDRGTRICGIRVHRSRVRLLRAISMSQAANCWKFTSMG